jgi:transposase
MGVWIDALSISLVTEGTLMLVDLFSPRLSEFDQEVYRLVVPGDHFLRKVLEVVPWGDFHDLLAPYYSPDMGRPPEPPVMMLKLEYLRYHHNLSDREVMVRAETDLAFRYFLQIPLGWMLPHPSSLCIFRGRLGVKGFRQVFR